MTASKIGNPAITQQKITPRNSALPSIENFPGIINNRVRWYEPLYEKGVAKVDLPKKYQVDGNYDFYKYYTELAEILEARKPDGTPLVTIIDPESVEVDIRRIPDDIDSIVDFNLLRLINNHMFNVPEEDRIRLSLRVVEALDKLFEIEMPVLYKASTMARSLDRPQSLVRVRLMTKQLSLLLRLPEKNEDKKVKARDRLLALQQEIDSYKRISYSSDEAKDEIDLRYTIRDEIPNVLALLSLDGFGNAACLEVMSKYVNRLNNYHEELKPNYFYDENVITENAPLRYSDPSRLKYSEKIEWTIFELFEKTRTKEDSFLQTFSKVKVVLLLFDKDVPLTKKVTSLKEIHNDLSMLKREYIKKLTGQTHFIRKRYEPRCDAIDIELRKIDRLLIKMDTSNSEKYIKEIDENIKENIKNLQKRTNRDEFKELTLASREVGTINLSKEGIGNAIHKAYIFVEKGELDDAYTVFNGLTTVDYFASLPEESKQNVRAERFYGMAIVEIKKKEIAKATANLTAAIGILESIPSQNRTEKQTQKLIDGYLMRNEIKDTLDSKDLADLGITVGDGKLPLLITSFSGIEKQEFQSRLHLIRASYYHNPPEPQVPNVTKRDDEFRKIDEKALKAEGKDTYLLLNGNINKDKALFIKDTEGFKAAIHKAIKCFDSVSEDNTELSYWAKNGILDCYKELEDDENVKKWLDKTKDIKSDKSDQHRLTRAAAYIYLEDFPLAAIELGKVQGDRKDSLFYFLNSLIAFNKEDLPVTRQNLNQADQKKNGQRLAQSIQEQKLRLGIKENPSKENFDKSVSELKLASDSPAVQEINVYRLGQTGLDADAKEALVNIDALLEKGNVKTSKIDDLNLLKMNLNYRLKNKTNANANVRFEYELSLNSFKDRKNELTEKQKLQIELFDLRVQMDSADVSNRVEDAALVINAYFSSETIQLKKNSESLVNLRPSDLIGIIDHFIKYLRLKGHINSAQVLTNTIQGEPVKDKDSLRLSDEDRGRFEIILKLVDLYKNQTAPSVNKIVNNSYIQEGYVLLETGNVKDAETEFNKVLNSTAKAKLTVEDDLSAKIGLLNVLMAQGKTDEVNKLIIELDNNKDINSFTHLQSGYNVCKMNWHVRIGDIAAAEEIYGTIIVQLTKLDALKVNMMMAANAQRNSNYYREVLKLAKIEEVKTVISGNLLLQTELLEVVTEHEITDAEAITKMQSFGINYTAKTLPDIWAFLYKSALNQGNLPAIMKTLLHRGHDKTSGIDVSSEVKAVVNTDIRLSNPQLFELLELELQLQGTDLAKIEAIIKKPVYEILMKSSEDKVNQTSEGQIMKVRLLAMKIRVGLRSESIEKLENALVEIQAIAASLTGANFVTAAKVIENMYRQVIRIKVYQRENEQVAKLIKSEDLLKNEIERRCKVAKQEKNEDIPENKKLKKLLKTIAADLKFIHLEKFIYAGEFSQARETIAEIRKGLIEQPTEYSDDDQIQLPIELLIDELKMATEENDSDLFAKISEELNLSLYQKPPAEKIWLTAQKKFDAEIASWVLIGQARGFPIKFSKETQREHLFKSATISTVKRVQSQTGSDSLEVLKDQVQELKKLLKVLHAQPSGFEKKETATALIAKLRQLAIADSRVLADLRFIIADFQKMTFADDPKLKNEMTIELNLLIPERTAISRQQQFVFQINQLLPQSGEVDLSKVNVPLLVNVMDSMLRYYNEIGKDGSAMVSLFSKVFLGQDLNESEQRTLELQFSGLPAKQLMSAFKKIDEKGVNDNKAKYLPHKLVHDKIKVYQSPQQIDLAKASLDELKKVYSNLKANMKDPSRREAVLKQIQLMTGMQNELFVNPREWALATWELLWLNANDNQEMIKIFGELQTHAKGVLVECLEKTLLGENSDKVPFDSKPKANYDQIPGKSNKSLFTAGQQAVFLSFGNKVQTQAANQADDLDNQVPRLGVYSSAMRKDMNSEIDIMRAANKVETLRMLMSEIPIEGKYVLSKKSRDEWKTDELYREQNQQLTHYSTMSTSLLNDWKQFFASIKNETVVNDTGLTSKNYQAALAQTSTIILTQAKAGGPSVDTKQQAVNTQGEPVDIKDFLAVSPETKQALINEFVTDGVMEIYTTSGKNISSKHPTVEQILESIQIQSLLTIDYEYDQTPSWKTVEETMQDKKGDCEDIAIRQYVAAVALLEKFGYTAAIKDLYLVLDLNKAANRLTTSHIHMVYKPLTPQAMDLDAAYVMNRLSDNSINSKDLNAYITTLRAKGVDTSQFVAAFTQKGSFLTTHPQSEVYAHKVLDLDLLTEAAATPITPTSSSSYHYSDHTQTNGKTYTLGSDGTLSRTTYENTTTVSGANTTSSASSAQADRAMPITQWEQVGVAADVIEVSPTEQVIVQGKFCMSQQIGDFGTADFLVTDKKIKLKFHDGSSAEYDNPLGANSSAEMAILWVVKLMANTKLTVDAGIKEGNIVDNKQIGFRIEQRKGDLTIEGSIHYRDINEVSAISIDTLSNQTNSQVVQQQGDKKNTSQGFNQVWKTLFSSWRDERSTTDAEIKAVYKQDTYEIDGLLGATSTGYATQGPEGKGQLGIVMKNWKTGAVRVQFVDEQSIIGNPIEYHNQSVAATLVSKCLGNVKTAVTASMYQESKTGPSPVDSSGFRISATFEKELSQFLTGYGVIQTDSSATVVGGGLKAKISLSDLLRKAGVNIDNVDLSEFAKEFPMTPGSTKEETLNALVKQYEANVEYYQQKLGHAGVVINPTMYKGQMDSMKAFLALDMFYSFDDAAIGNGAFTGVEYQKVVKMVNSIFEFTSSFGVGLPSLAIMPETTAKYSQVMDKSTKNTLNVEAGIDTLIPFFNIYFNQKQGKLNEWLQAALKGINSKLDGFVSIDLGLKTGASYEPKNQLKKYSTHISTAGFCVQWGDQVDGMNKTTIRLPWWAAIIAPVTLPFAVKSIRTPGDYVIMGDGTILSHNGDNRYKVWVPEDINPEIQAAMSDFTAVNKDLSDKCIDIFFRKEDLGTFFGPTKDKELGALADILRQIGLQSTALTEKANAAQRQHLSIYLSEKKDSFIGGTLSISSKVLNELIDMPVEEQAGAIERYLAQQVDGHQETTNSIGLVSSLSGMQSIEVNLKDAILDKISRISGILKDANLSNGTELVLTDNMLARVMADEASQKGFDAFLFRLETLVKKFEVAKHLTIGLDSGFLSNLFGKLSDSEYTINVPTTAIMKMKDLKSKHETIDARTQAAVEENVDLGQVQHALKQAAITLSVETTNFTAEDLTALQSIIRMLINGKASTTKPIWLSRIVIKEKGSVRGDDETLTLSLETLRSLNEPKKKEATRSELRDAVADLPLSWVNKMSNKIDQFIGINEALSGFIQSKQADLRLHTFEMDTKTNEDFVWKDQSEMWNPKFFVNGVSREDQLSFCVLLPHEGNEGGVEIIVKSPDGSQHRMKLDEMKLSETKLFYRALFIALAGHIEGNGNVKIEGMLQKFLKLIHFDMQSVIDKLKQDQEDGQKTAQIAKERLTQLASNLHRIQESQVA